MLGTLYWITSFHIHHIFLLLKEFPALTGIRHPAQGYECKSPTDGSFTYLGYTINLLVYLYYHLKSQTAKKHM